MLTPRDKTFSFAFNRDHSVSFRVPLLFAGTGPAAVFLAVWAIVVLAIYGEPIRTTPHIFVELQEASLPLLANSDSASTVSGVISVLFTVTPIDHASPDSVLPQGFNSNSDNGFSGSKQTPAGLGITASEVGGWCCDFLAALTGAYPVSFLIQGVAISDCGKLSEFLASNVENAGHPWYLGNRFRHSCSMFGFSAGRRSIGGLARSLNSNTDSSATQNT